MSSWKLTLPLVNTSTGWAAEIGSDLGTSERAEISNYVNTNYYFVNGNAVRFVTPINGTRTSNNTKFARTELRELYSSSAAGAVSSPSNSWACSNSAAQARGMYIEQALIQATPVTPKVAIGQIHDTSNDNLMVAYNNGKITVSFNNNSSTVDLDTSYTLGDKMSVDISVSSSALMTVVYKNITQNKATVTKTMQMSGVSGSGCYFKAGNYIQDCINKNYSYTDASGQTNQNNPSCDKSTTLANINDKSINDIYKLILR